MKRDEHVNDMPDIEIIDLENETVQDTDFGKSDISDDFEGNPDDEYEENDREEEEEEHPAPKGIRRFLNLHVLFALVLLVVVGLLGYRITHWGQRVSQSDIFKDGQGSYQIAITHHTPSASQSTFTDLAMPSQTPTPCPSGPIISWE